MHLVLPKGRSSPKKQNEVMLNKRMKIVCDDIKWKQSMSSRNSAKSLHSTNNSELPARPIPPRIDLSHFSHENAKRNCSIPYILKKNQDVDHHIQCKSKDEAPLQASLEKHNKKNVNSQQQYDQQFILSPIKVCRNVELLQKKQTNRFSTVSSSKQKVVILSTSDCKQVFSQSKLKQFKQTQELHNQAKYLSLYESNKQMLKIKIKTRNKKRNQTQKQIINEVNPELVISRPPSATKISPKKIPNKQGDLTYSKSSQIRKTDGQRKRPEPSKNKQIEERAKINLSDKQQGSPVNIASWLQQDLQILRMYPKIDLSVLVLKIKHQECVRKEHSINRWANFKYSNIPELQA